ncbi:cellulase family glycosylhydrolase [Halocatena salina]|uniref:Cellulase family glycosylhydrolase n=1 Tax=Halocatena salina TaxID=2934340 RepID=A0A8U0A8Q8_9EURY|nr:cellulase family glycosylhydrolase [Halocatena salina]UPM44413.1 cellulase family glycosylhydrolase [Halocatena salina]
MTHDERTTASETGSNHDRTVDTLSRRDILKSTVAAGALAAGVGTGVVDTTRAAVVSTPPLHVDGNLVKDPDGQTVTLRGINIADPKRINVTASARGKTAEQVVTMLTDTERDWHSRAIRIPVQPVDIGEHEPGQGPPPVAFSREQLETYLTNHLDPLIEHCLSRGTYAIVDYHRHRDIQWTDTALHEEVELFWDTVAPRYADEPHVMYELYNEPQEPGMWGDPTQSSNWADVWRDWKSTAQPWVDLIRSHAADNLVLIGSPSWTQSPEGALVEPFDGSNLAYTYHIYPGHSVSAESCHCWDDATTNGEGVAQVYEEYPLFVTEFGWERNGGQFIGGTDTFGTAFLDWLEQSDAIHWTAWCGDPVWRPVLFDLPFHDGSWEDAIGNPYEEEIPTVCPELPCDWSLATGDGHMGDDVKDTLYELRNHRPPTVPYDPDAPPVPSELTVDGVTEITVDVSWSAVEDVGEAGLSHYNVYIDGTEHVRVDRGTTSTTITELSSDTSYEFGVSAVDRARNESSRVTATATTDAFEDATPPSVPGDVSSPSNTYRSVSLTWMESTDEGDAETAGMDHYNVYLDGRKETTVPATTTETTLSGLDADTTYEFGVSAVDRADNESEPATVSVTTDLAAAGPDDLLIDDYDDPSWPSANDLGNWTGSGGFEHIDVVDGALRIEYDSSGWYGTQVSRDITAYPTLRLKVVGDDGGEHEDIQLDFGGVRTDLSRITADSIGTTESIVSIDLEAAGVNLTSPGQLDLRFYGGGTGAIEIEELWLDHEERG